jgi:hypothetical protein
MIESLKNISIHIIGGYDIVKLENDINMWLARESAMKNVFDIKYATNSSETGAERHYAMIIWSPIR